MAWHTRPAGPSAFPNGTAAAWATAWFTPITAAKLNYLKDNLEFLRSPPRSIAESTPGATFGGSGTVVYSTATPIISGTLTDYAGGKVYLFFSAELLAPAATGVGNIMMQLTNAGGTYYLDRRGQLQTANTTLFITHQTQQNLSYHHVSSMLIIDPSALAGNSITWGVRLSGGATASVKNARMYLREL